MWRLYFFVLWRLYHLKKTASPSGEAVLLCYIIVESNWWVSLGRSGQIYIVLCCQYRHKKSNLID